MELQEIEASLRADDNKALQYLYLEYGDFCVKRLKSKRQCTIEEAEDLFIEAVMILRENILKKKISSLSNPGYYLYRICENKFLEKLRADKNKQAKQSDVEHFFYSMDHESDFIGEWDSELSKAADHAFKNLGERCREIIYYFYVDKLSMLEISKLMNLASADVAKNTKARCYKKLVTEANQFYNQLLNHGA